MLLGSRLHLRIENRGAAAAAGLSVPDGYLRIAHKVLGSLVQSRALRYADTGRYIQRAETHNHRLCQRAKQTASHDFEVLEFVQRVDENRKLIRADACHNVVRADDAG